MLYLGQETGFEFWNFVYMVYLMWIAGLLAFSLIATSHESPQRIIRSMRHHWLGMIGILWISGSVLAAHFGWPLLLMAPFIVVQVGAPVSAGIMIAIFIILTPFLIWKALTERWPALCSHR